MPEVKPPWWKHRFLKLPVWSWATIIVVFFITAIGLAGGDGKGSDSVTSTTTTTIEPPVTTEPQLSPSQEQAVRSAQSFLDLQAFSRQKLIDQLTSEYGDQVPLEDATIAVDSLHVDWNAQAVKSAKSYSKHLGLSCERLIDQLTSEYGGQFTVEQATYGATAADIC